MRPHLAPKFFVSRQCSNDRGERVVESLSADAFFECKPAAEKPWSAKPHWRFKLWTYDLRTNKHFTLKEPSSSEIDWRSVSPKGQRCSADQNPLKRRDLDDFVACYNPKNRHERKESERFKSFSYEELTKRDP